MIDGTNQRYDGSKGIQFDRRHKKKRVPHFQFLTMEKHRTNSAKKKENQPPFLLKDPRLFSSLVNSIPILFISGKAKVSRESLEIDWLNIEHFRLITKRKDGKLLEFLH
jgi:hypothetical protein